MSILTKKLTMTETAWAALKTMLTAQPDRNADQYGLNFMDVQDAITALSEATIVSVTDTYATTRRNRDEWLRQAVDVGVTPDVPLADAAPTLECTYKGTHVEMWEPTEDD